MHPQLSALHILTASVYLYVMRRWSNEQMHESFLAGVQMWSEEVD